MPLGCSKGEQRRMGQRQRGARGVKEEDARCGDYLLCYVKQDWVVDLGGGEGGRAHKEKSGSMKTGV